MRILLLTTTIDVGGAEVQVLGLAESFARQGHEVHLVSMRRPRMGAERALEAGARLVDLGMEGALGLPAAMARFVGLVRGIRPDVIHAHMYHANMLARLTRPALRVPVVSTAHSVFEYSARLPQLGRFRDLAYRITDPLGDITAHVSREGLERYVAQGLTPADRIRLVDNGVDFSRFVPAEGEREPGPFRWICVGRFASMKGHADLLRAFAQVPGDSTLQLVGDGPLLDEMKQLAAELGLGDRVVFAGRQFDVPDRLRRSDALVLASHYEGLPMVLLEGHGTGLPIVATDVGAIRDVVRDEETGFVVPKASPDALRDAMARLEGLSEAERLQMGRAGRAHVQSHYGMDAVTARWLELYRSL